MTRIALRIVAAIVVAGMAGIARAETPVPTPGAPVASTSPPPVAKGTPSPDDSVVLNFEGADIREVIHSLADSLGINYQIDPRIQGQVTIRTTGPIAKEDLFPIFNRILRSNGISAVQVGDIYQIIPVAEAKTKAIIPVASGEKRRAAHEDAFVIEVVRVEHVAAQEMVNVLQPFVTPGGDVIPYARANLLIVTDLESNVARLKDLVNTFDRDAFRDLRAKVYKIEHANIEEIGQELIAIMDTYGVTPASAEERGVYIIPLQRLNSLVIVAFNPTIFAEVDRWMKLLDVPPEEGAGRSVHVYAVENAKAADLAEILSELYGEGSSSRGNQQQQFTPFGTRQRGGIGGAQPAGRAAAPVVGRQNNPAPVIGGGAPRVNQMLDDFDDYAPLQQFDDSSGGLGSSSSSSSRRGRSGGLGGGSSSSRGGFGNTNNSSAGFGNSQGAQGFVLAGGEPGDIFRQEVRIVADEVTNSLVVLATKKDYADIREVLRRLDVVPRQVLIEVLVAEVTLGDDMKFGVEFAAADLSRNNALGRITGESTTSTNNSNNNSTTNNQASIFDLGAAIGNRSADVVPLPGSGLFGVISDNRNFAVVMNAAAGKNKLKVLSAPHIMTADNHEAHILVGNEVPIVTTQSNSTLTTTNGTSNILQNIQYRDTGVILTVLPQVNSEGLVNMQIRQEVSQVASATTGGIQSPTFSTRESETTVVVQSGETIVIGGIIDDTVDRSRTGIPFLMDIPVVGRAFRVESDTVRRTELIVLLTPHVVRDRQESRNATEAFKSRLKGMERDLYRYEAGRPDYGSGRPSSESLDDMRVSPPTP